MSNRKMQITYGVCLLLHVSEYFVVPSGN